MVAGSVCAVRDLHALDRMSPTARHFAATAPNALSRSASFTPHGKGSEGGTGNGIRELFREKNIGVILVLHDINMAARFCDKITALHSGRLVAQDIPIHRT
ncbi:Iron(3+)-hydroxamate import ATP-binding protein FhuC [Blastochloris viridis]|uniref:Iron(3+)-hydroxamate import ATP-binding protein FhuC n=1 Tax=Blastochloris viridis TaxID=1079 RepID=A0A0H5BCY2_BLAVI|nr:Iron(3+)-hydroxamate import ATP-binding protein FhuC [Blastochloris viridis]BAS00088.1 hypothetical protein BV133_2494 [Blastochloris viridis]CUU42658.1 Iron(3+)-hydroxamate import ATP-binding protein FhuC [Blastochloris viridis]